MTDVTLKPLQPTAVPPAPTTAERTDLTGTATTGHKATGHRRSHEKAAPADTVTVSDAAKSLSQPAPTDATALSEAEAVAASSQIRDQLKSAGLSSSARQNQAILSLLR